MPKRVYGKVDLTDWSLEAIEHLREAANAIAQKALAEVIDVALNDDEFISLQLAVFSRDTNRDPLDLDIVFEGLGKNEAPFERDTGLAVGFNLRDTVVDMLKDCSDDSSGLKELRSLSAALKSLTSDIDAVTEQWGDATEDGTVAARR